MKNDEKYCVAFKNAWGKTAFEIGLKGYGIADMYRMGIPVPDGFVINTSLCQNYFRRSKEYRKEILKQAFAEIDRELQQLEERTGKRLSGSDNCLILSVRSGAAVSMPGILATYCNITNREELAVCIEKVLQSWDSERAKMFREQSAIPEDYGTAVIIQQMVNGMASVMSGTGVCYTRNPSSGKNELFGEFLFVAQGENLVGGKTLPYGLSEMKKQFPAQYEELTRYAKLLENHYHNVQEIEFTIEDGKLYILQTRKARCSQYARMIWNSNSRLECEKEMPLGYSKCIDKENYKMLGEGIPLGIGDIYGRVAYTLEDVNKWKEAGENVIYICEDLSIEHMEAFFKADGIVSASGGVTSHAASLALGAGKRCITAFRLQNNADSICVNEKDIAEGTSITLDMENGRIYDGILSMIQKKCLN